MNKSFSLHPQLDNDTILIGHLPLCQVRLMNESQYPWVIAIPQRPNVSEIFQLAEPDQQQLMNESVSIGKAMMNAYGGDKLNVAMLGNIVPQLHIHHIVRTIGDPAWPAPVWGHAPTTPYTQANLKLTTEIVCSALSEANPDFKPC